MKKKNHLPLPLVVGAIVGTLAGLVFLNLQDTNTSRTTVLLADETTNSATTPQATPTTTDSSSGTNQPTNGSDSTDNDLNNAKENLKWDKENYKNRSNELKNNFKNTKADLTDLNAKMATWLGYLNSMEAAVNGGDTGTFWDLNSEEDSMSQDINDAFNGAYAQSNLEGSKENALKNKPRELKDLERQLKDLQRSSKKNPVDTSGFETSIAQMNDLITRMQAIANTSTSGLSGDELQDLNSDLSDLIRDFEDLANDFRNNINDLNQTVNTENQIDNAERNLKDKARTIKDLEREYKRLAKQIGQEKIANLTTAIQTLRDIYAQIEAAIAAKDVDTLNYIDQDFWSANTDAYDILNEYNEMGNQENLKKDAERITKEKDRQLKDMRRECKRVECENTDSGQKIAELENLLKRMQEIAQSGDQNAFWDLNSQFDDLNREFWDTISNQGQSKDLTRWLKDLSRELKDKGRWIADMEREAKNGEAPFSSEEVAQLQQLYEKMIDAVKRAQASLVAGNSQEAQDILNTDFNDFRMEFDEITMDFGNRREAGFMKFEIENLKREIEQDKLEIEKALLDGRIDRAKADLCYGYIGQAAELMDSLSRIMEEDKVGEQEEIMIRLEKIGNESDRQCGEVFGPSDDHKAYVDYYVRDDLQDMADQIFTKISEKLEGDFMNRVLEKIGQYQNTINLIIEEAGQKWQTQLESKLQDALTVWDTTAKENVEALLNQQARLLEHSKRLEEKVASKSKELDELQELLASYNYYGNSAEEMETELEHFVSSDLNESEKLQKIRELKTKAERARESSREEKFRDGIIPYKDTDDNEWFTRYVASLSEEGIISGYRDAQGNLTGQFGPGDQVTISQVLKMALESAGAGQADGEPALRQASNHWSKGYIKQAENLGLSIVSGLSNLDRPATRAEVVRIILEVKGIRPGSLDRSSFSDVSNSDPNAGYIEEAKNLNIVSGDSGRNTFRPNDGINRAEVAKIINNALSYLYEESEESFESGDDDFNPGFRYEEGLEPAFVEEI